LGLRCDVPVFAPEDPCPWECPYLAEDAMYICHFRCVTAEDCGTLDPLAIVADDKQMTCRRCNVPGCFECDPLKKDFCVKCGSGYFINGDGKCISPGAYVMLAIQILILIVFLGLVAWYLELRSRKPTNHVGLRQGLSFRYRTRIHMPADTPDGEGVNDVPIDEETVKDLQLHPLTTNMMRQPVAGAGTCLHFNFGVFTFSWAFMICYIYGCFACFVSTDLLILGMTPAKTPQELCAVIHWGRKTQIDLIRSEIFFVIFCYIFSFWAVIKFGIYQHREFHRLDDEVDMKDYMAICSGLPKISGASNAEAKIQEFLEEQTGQSIVGVSICWNYKDKAKEVKALLEKDWKQLEEEITPEMPDPEEELEEAEKEISAVRKLFMKVDAIFGFRSPKVFDDVEEEEMAPENIKELLDEMESSDVAFVVFNTEGERDAAVEKVKEADGLEYEEDYTLRLSVKNCLPQSARFSGLCHGTDKANQKKHLSTGAGTVSIALVLWAGCFYTPYAYYMSSFSYSQGDAPSFFSSMLFTILVVAGNQVMYFLADDISFKADFPWEDDREVAYNIIYYVACVLNLIADMVVTVILAYKIMVGNGVHTADDRLLSELPSFREVFESYPIQKAFGTLLFSYCFPACFLIPFVLEGLFTIALPYHVAKLLVLSHEEVRHREAEKSMVHFLPFNMGRYSDIALNMTLCCVSLFTPGGFTIPIFLSFPLCHLGIYCYDHYRVLRCTPNFCYADDIVDFFGQLQLTVPIGLIASCCVFRASQSWFQDIKDHWLYLSMIGAFLGHVVIHALLICFFVPRFAPEPHQPAKETYEELAKTTPATWFSVNPVHCLRSKYIYQHDPPLVYFKFGKEHLQKANPDIGAHYERCQFVEMDPEKIEQAKKQALEAEDDAP